MQQSKRVLVVGVLVALALASCNDPNESADPVVDRDQRSAETAGTSGSLCQVSDASSPEQRTISRIALDGAMRAAGDFGITVEVAEAASVDDFEAHIQRFVEDDCTLIVTVGAALSTATAESARANEDQYYAIVDFVYPEQIDNVMTLDFNTAEPSFLAGYLAAGMTTTGNVATYGGINIGPVTMSMDGFVNGVALYNRRNSSSVQALGWDGSDGRFAGNFDDVDDGRSLASDYAEQDVDVIFPVAGRVGIGSAAFAAETGGLRIIGIETDRYVTDPADASVYLTSVVKHVDQAVYAAAERVIVDGQPGGTYVGTLENGGVGLAPYHDQADDVPDELDRDIEALTAEVVAGDVSVT